VRPLPLTLIVTAVAAACCAGGCGDDDAPPAPPPGPFAETLSQISGGGPANASLGISWVAPELASPVGGRHLIETVLAPNADTVVEGTEVLKRRYGFDPLAAERLVSVGGSYAFGLRLDGVDGRGLAKALVAEGGTSHEVDGLEQIEIGAYAVVPHVLLDADVNGLGAFDALGSDLSVLAISDRALAALLGEGDPLLDKPTYAAAAHCLGPDVVAVRMVPDKQLLGTDLDIDLAAFGVTADDDVLCILGGTAERADAVEANLKVGLGSSTPDPVTGERLGASVAADTVSRETYDGVEIVRAELERAADTEPGFLLATISTGSLVSLINGEAESPLP
jgi:hypothetical protein